MKISFRSMVYEDALTILSYASPYDVELEVETGGNSAGSRPATLLKKSVGPSPSRICHPLYRSQSIPELSQAHKTSAKRLFIADPNESLGSNYSTMNSTMKSSKSTPGSQTLERRHEEAKSNNHHHHHQNHQKFGIKVLPALDGTVHRIENQNEHNTNLERRHSRKLDFAREPIISGDRDPESHESHRPEAVSERYQKRENRIQEPAVSVRPVEKSSVARDPSEKRANGLDVLDMASSVEPPQEKVEAINIPSEVPAEVHNAAMAARRNRRNSAELLGQPKSAGPEVIEASDAKSPQKNKRKAPAPPRTTGSEPEAARHQRREQSSPTKHDRENPDDSIESITDYAESLNEYLGKVREVSPDDDAAVRRQLSEKNSSNRRGSLSDSDTDSEVHDSFTTIELKPADITIHHTPVPRVEGDPDENDDDDDVYRKAASLGDLSKYEAKSLATLERAQSLDMADTGSKKRKVVPIPPEDINESTEDLTKLNDVDSFDRRKLKKSTEWGTLQDAIWNKPDSEDTDPMTRTRKRSNGTLERSKSAVEIKLKEEPDTVRKTPDGRIVPAEMPEDTSIELYNLPLSMRLTREFIESERMFNPDEDNALARIVNNGTIVKGPTPEEIELDFRQARPMSDEVDEEVVRKDSKETSFEGPTNDELGMALRYFDLQINRASNPDRSIENPRNPDRKDDDFDQDEYPSRGRRSAGEDMYAGRKEALEEPMRKVTVVTRPCPGCEKKFGQHDYGCNRMLDNNGEVIDRDSNDWQPQEVCKLSESPNDERSAFRIGIKKFETVVDAREKAGSPTDSRIERQLLRERGVEIDDEEEEGYEFGSGLGAKTSSPAVDRHNVSNVSVSSGENSEDSGLVGESGDYRRESVSRPPLPETPMPMNSSPQKLTYITEIKVSASRENLREVVDDLGEASPRKDAPKPPRNDVNVTSNGKSNVGKKPPVPPRRNDASKLASREPESGDKSVVYVSEYKPGDRDRNENTDRLASSPGDKVGSKKFEHWIFLGDNKEQNPWGNGSSQSQSAVNVVVAPGDKKTNIHQ